MKLKAYLLLTRPVNLLITSSTVLVGLFLCAGEKTNLFVLILAPLSAALAAAAGNIINDYFDLEIDKINRPARPLAFGTISKKSAMFFYVVLSLTSLILASFININTFTIDFLAVVLLFYYSYKIKQIFLLGNFVIAFLTGLAFIYAGTSVNNISFAVIPAVFAFLINFIREIVKDMEDLEGDSAKGVLTFPKRFGFSAAKKVVFFTTLVLIFFYFLSFCCAALSN